MIYLAQHKIYTLYLVANLGIKIGLTFFMKKLYFPNSLCESRCHIMGFYFHLIYYKQKLFSNIEIGIYFYPKL